MNQKKSWRKQQTANSGIPSNSYKYIPIADSRVSIMNHVHDNDFRIESLFNYTRLYSVLLFSRASGIQLAFGCFVCIVSNVNATRDR